MAQQKGPERAFPLSAGGQGERVPGNDRTTSTHDWSGRRAVINGPKWASATCSTTSSCPGMGMLRRPLVKLSSAARGEAMSRKRAARGADRGPTKYADRRRRLWRPACRRYHRETSSVWARWSGAHGEAFTMSFSGRVSWYTTLRMRAGSVARAASRRWRGLSAASWALILTGPAARRHRSTEPIRATTRGVGGSRLQVPGGAWSAACRHRRGHGRGRARADVGADRSRPSALDLRA